MDDATGVLLKLVGSNSEGRTVYAIDVSSLSIDRGVQPDIALLTKPPAGWTAVAPSRLINLQVH